MKIQDYTVISARCNGQGFTVEVPYYIFTDAIEDDLSTEGLAIELKEYIENLGISFTRGNDIELTHQSLNIVKNMCNTRNRHDS